MILTIPLAALLGLIVLLLHRDSTLKPWQSLITGLFGLSLAPTPAGHLIDNLLRWAAHGALHR